VIQAQTLQSDATRLTALREIGSLCDLVIGVSKMVAIGILDNEPLPRGYMRDSRGRIYFAREISW